MKPKRIHEDPRPFMHDIFHGDPPLPAGAQVTTRRQGWRVSKEVGPDESGQEPTRGIGIQTGSSPAGRRRSHDPKRPL